MGASRAPAATPTPFAPLNAMLASFVARVKTTLGQKFVGAYLQGSFALDDFDEGSDVDVIVVIEPDLTDAEIAPLQKLHDEFHASAPPWSQRLELSYAPKAILRHWSVVPRDPPGAARADDWADPGTSGTPPHVYPFWFLGNGESKLVRSEHDNTRVVRSVLREHGIVLEGPDPRTLIDEVSPDDLRDDVLETFRKAAKALAKPDSLKTQALQAFFVLLYARMLHTLEKGAIASKKAAADWATASLPPRWRPLITKSLEARKANAAALQSPPNSADVAETQAFIAFANEKAAVRQAHASADAASRARAIIERQLAMKNQAGRGSDKWGGSGGGGHRHGGATPPPTRPGGRGRRG